MRCIFFCVTPLGKTRTLLVRTILAHFGVNVKAAQWTFMATASTLNAGSVRPLLNLSPLNKWISCCLKYLQPHGLLTGWIF